MRRPLDQGGLTVVRFSGSLLSEQGIDDTVGGISASIIDSRFKDNIFDFEGDLTVRSSRFEASCV